MRSRRALSSPSYSSTITSSSTYSLLLSLCLLLLILSPPSSATLTGCTTSYLPLSTPGCTVRSPSNTQCWDNGLPTTTSVACFPCISQPGISPSSGEPLDFYLNVAELKMGSCSDTGESARFEVTDNVNVAGDVLLDVFSRVVMKGNNQFVFGGTLTLDGGRIDDDGGATLIRGADGARRVIDLSDASNVQLYWGESTVSDGLTGMVNVELNLNEGARADFQGNDGMYFTNCTINVDSGAELLSNDAATTSRDPIEFTNTQWNVRGEVDINARPMIALDAASVFRLIDTGNIDADEDSTFTLPIIMEGTSPRVYLRADTSHVWRSLTATASNGRVTMLSGVSVEVTEVLSFQGNWEGRGTVTWPDTINCVLTGPTDFEPKFEPLAFGLGRTIQVTTADSVTVEFNVDFEEATLSLGTLDFTTSGKTLTVTLTGDVDAVAGNIPQVLVSWEGDNGIDVQLVYDVGFQITECPNAVVIPDLDNRRVVLYPSCDPGYCHGDSDCGNGEECSLTTGTCVSSVGGTDEVDGGQIDATTDDADADDNGDDGNSSDGQDDTGAFMLTPTQLIGSAVGLVAIGGTAGAFIMRRGGSSAVSSDSESLEKSSASTDGSGGSGKKAPMNRPKSSVERVKKLRAAEQGPARPRKRSQPRAGGGVSGVKTVPISAYRQSERSVATTNSLMAPDFS